jgi:AcrR family transcriptional regulator
MMPMATVTRKPTSVRREEIARTALSIIGERGLRELSTATLAREVGLTSGALFRHFPSMDAILAEAALDAVRRLETTFPDPSLPPREQILTLARNRIALLRPDPGLAWILRSEQPLLMLPPDAVVALRGLVLRTRTFLLDALAEGARAGTFRRDPEPATLLPIVLGTIHTLIGSAGVAREGSPPTGPDPEPVLRGLVSLLESPQGDPS